VVGYDTGSRVNFDWDWTPDDRVLGSEYYELLIKHETGNPTTTVKEIRIFVFADEQVISTDGIDESDVSVDWGSDIVRINKNAFPSDWDGFEVQISGAQNGRPVQTIPYQYWTLNR
jgi:hypothetical protein